MFSVTQKKELIELANKLFRMRVGTSDGLILCAKMDSTWKTYRPYLITWYEFERDQEFLLVDRKYKVITYEPDDEPEENIVTGSIDPKSQRRRKVIDVEKLRRIVKAAPIPDQVDWSQVPPFQLPQLDSVPGWSKAKDDEVTASLKAEGLYKPESTPVIPKMDFDKIFFHQNEKIIPERITEAIAKKLHEKYPENDFDRYFKKKLSVQNVFSKLTPEPAIHEVMRPAPYDLKSSILRTLVDSGHFELMPFKIEATALMMSRGYTNAELASHAFTTHVVGLRGLSDLDFEPFRWILSPKDFQSCQSIVSAMLESVENSEAEAPTPAGSLESLGVRVAVKRLWTRFENAFQLLTLKQQEAVKALYMGPERQKFETAAAKMGISVGSLRDRLVGATKKLREAFPEFSEFYPSRTHSALSKRPLIYDGLYRRESADLVRPLTRVKQIGALELREDIPAVATDKKTIKGPLSPLIAKWLDEYRLKAEFAEKLDEPVDRFSKASGLEDYDDFDTSEPRTKQLFEVIMPVSRKPARPRAEREPGRSDSNKG